MLPQGELCSRSTWAWLGCFLNLEVIKPSQGSSYLRLGWVICQGELMAFPNWDLEMAFDGTHGNPKVHTFTSRSSLELATTLLMGSYGSTNRPWLLHSHTSTTNLWMFNMKRCHVSSWGKSIQLLVTLVILAHFNLRQKSVAMTEMMTVDPETNLWDRCISVSVGLYTC